jgi:hypothetical protein
MSRRKTFTQEELKQNRLTDEQFEMARNEMLELFDNDRDSLACIAAEDKYWTEWRKRFQETEEKRYKKLPKFVKELQDAKPDAITIWDWMYPWNHPCQPKEFENTLTLLGDGFLQCRFDPISFRGNGKFKVLQKVGDFLNNRSPKFKSIQEGQVLCKKDLMELAKELV